MPARSWVQWSHRVPYLEKYRTRSQPIEDHLRHRQMISLLHICGSRSPYVSKTAAALCRTPLPPRPMMLAPRSVRERKPGVQGHHGATAPLRAELVLSSVWSALTRLNQLDVHDLGSR